MEFKPDMANVLKRYNAFWNNEISDDRPVVQILIQSKVKIARPLCEVNGDELLRYYEEVFQERLGLRDDTIPIISTFAREGHTLLPALLGARVKTSGGSRWNEPILEKLEDFRSLRLDWQCEVWQRFQDFYQRFAKASQGRFCLPLHLAKSPGELLAALRGPQQLSMDFVDRPELIEEYGQRCLALAIEYGKRIQADVKLTTIAQGHVYCYANWVPGDTTCFSEDYTVLWSPNTYRQFIRPLDVSYIKAFTVSNMEWHSGCAHVFSSFPKVDAVEFNLDPAHASILETFPVLAPYIGKTRFLIPCNKEEARAVIETFGINGLMLVVKNCNTVDEGNRLLDQITQWTQEYKKRHGSGKV